MDKQHTQLTLGLIILGGFAFIYCSDLFLTIREVIIKGNWFPLLLVIACTIYACLQSIYLYFKNKEEQERQRPPMEL